MVSITRQNTINLYEKAYPENEKLNGLADTTLLDKEKEAYDQLRRIESIIHMWNLRCAGEHSCYLSSIEDILLSDDEFMPPNNISDFDKLSSIWKLFKKDRINSLHLLNETKAILNN